MNRDKDEFSLWSGHNLDAPAHLVAVSPPKRLEVNGAPVVEETHEHVVGKRDTDAAD